MKLIMRRWRVGSGVCSDDAPGGNGPHAFSAQLHSKTKPRSEETLIAADGGGSSTCGIKFQGVPKTKQGGQSP